MIISNWGAVANSTCAFAIRMFIFSSLSVLRSFSRRFSSSTLGGFTNTAKVSCLNLDFIRNPPATSISKITFLPFAQMRSISALRVP